jgi:hypothetical protein
MSSMWGRPGWDAEDLAAEVLDFPGAFRARTRRRVSSHRGDRFDFLERHRQEASEMLKQGRAGIEKIAPSLLRRIADERALRVAWDHLSKNGGQAPGPDDLRYDDFPDSQVWEECRALRDSIRARTYALGGEHVHWISKGSGRGKRPLIIQNILDRVV